MTNLKIVNRSYIKNQVELLELKKIQYLKKNYRMNLLEPDSGKKRDMTLGIDTNLSNTGKNVGKI